MRYLGIDFGLRRIGLAVSEGELATSWQVLEVKNFKEGIEKVSKIIKKEEFEKVIVGLPEGKMGKSVIGFINALKKAGFLIETSDETLSSKNAMLDMIEMGIPQEKRKHNDAQAAAIILQNYLDNR